MGRGTLNIPNRRARPAQTASLGVAILALGAAPSGAAGQPPGARLVEQGVADVGPLSLSHRLLPRDLRRPTGFDRVYELTRTTAFGTEQTLIRIDGAVTAVFPRSVYRGIAPGVSVADIPPGTIFYIGRLPPEFDPPESPHHPSRASLSLDLSAAGHGTDLTPAGDARPQRPEAKSPAAGPPGLAEPPSIWTDEEFRRLRLAQLLRAARATRPKETP
jgi:hypothetical protein